MIVAGIMNYLVVMNLVLAVMNLVLLVVVEYFNMMTNKRVSNPLIIKSSFQLLIYISCKKNVRKFLKIGISVT